MAVVAGLKKESTTNTSRIHYKSDTFCNSKIITKRIRCHLLIKVKHM